MKQLTTTFLWMLAGATALLAQSSVHNATELKGIVYNKEMTADFKLHTYGWAVGFNSAKIKTYYRTSFYGIELGELRHHKEYRQRNEYNLSFIPGASTSPRSYSYGKQNSFFALRGTYGEKRYFTDKAAHKGVAVGMSWAVGPSIGILKPYYLEIINRFSDPATIVSQKYDPAKEQQFLDYANIYGYSGFLKGLDEISLLPGGHGRIALHLDWGAYDEFVKVMEIGAMLDVYPKKVPIMVSEENRPFFLNFYLTLQLGKRW